MRTLMLRFSKQTAGLLTALLLSAALAFPAAGQTILNATAPEREAVRDGDYTALRSLLVQGGSPETPDSNGFTLLIDAARLQYLDIMDLLLEYGANINQGDRAGNTALHWAAIENAYDAIEFLAEKNANPNAQNRRGETPLIAAVRNGDSLSVELILAMDPDLSMRDYTGKSALDYARTARDRKIAPMLEAAGAR